MKWTKLSGRPPAEPGLYGVYLDGELAYIGMAQSLRARLQDHSLPVAVMEGRFRGAKFREIFVKVRIEPCNLKRQRLESAMIKRVCPELNRKGNPSAKKKDSRLNFREYMQTMNPLFRKFVSETGSQADVAKLLGMSPGHVSLLCSGKRKVTPAMAERIEIASGGKYQRESFIFPVRKQKSTLRRARRRN